MDVTLASHLLCAAAYLVLALLLGLHSRRRLPVLGLVAACATTGLWSLVVALDAGFAVGLGAIVGVLDILRSLAWVTFLAVAFRAGLPEDHPAPALRWGGLAAALLGVFLLAHTLIAGAPQPTEAGDAFLVPDLYARLLLATGGLVLAEALARQARSEGHWRIRYLCLGVGAILGYELFVWSEALVFQRVHPALAATRGAVSVVAVPLIAVAAARNPIWSTELNVSRRAAFHTVTLIVVGVYMLALAGVGAALRASSGQWGPMLQATLVFAGLLLLALIGFSPSARSLLKLRLSGYFFTHRHDYREQWQRFAEALSASASGESLAARALRALAEVVGSRHGALWMRESDVFAVKAKLGMPRVADAPAEGKFAEWLDENRDRVVDVGNSVTRQDHRLPDWLREWQDAWVVVPLVQRHVVGFVVLTRSRVLGALGSEEEELLRTAAFHAASYLVADQTTRRLEEARRFEELSRGMAFIAHDLRNVANELTLTLSNARSHIQNPEFQRDLILSMEDSVAAMQRLLDKLARGQGASPVAAEGGEPTDFAQLLRDALKRRKSDATELSLDLEGQDPLPIACDPDRLVSISGHLIQNAIEAAGPEGHVTVRLRREGEASVFEVEDDGPGMSPAFLRERLLHPFRSSKRGGFGLGLFECRQIAQELGGQLSIDTEPGRGTVARVRLPLAKDAPPPPVAEAR
jgi:putative PEP-CTERM system histidine kinase